MKHLKKITRTILAFFAILAFVSCRYVDPLRNESRDVDFLNHTTNVIHGNTLDLKIVGGYTVAIHDTLLIVISSNPNAHLQVFDSRSLEPIAMLCQQGHAKNEFSDAFVYKTDQTFIRNGDLIIVLRGEGGSVIKEFNVSASIKEGKTVVEGVNNLPFGSETVSVLDNNINHLFTFNNHNYSIDQDEYNVPDYSVINDNSSEKIRIYRRLANFENDVYSTFWYSGTMCKHPTRNLVVQCMASMDYIHFFDIDNNNCFSVHQSRTPTFKSIMVPFQINKNGTYEYDSKHFGEMVTSDDFFLVLYFGGEYCLREHSKGNYDASELLAFDWQGNYLGGVKLDMLAHDLAYDSLTRTLYGYNIRDEKIVTFELSDFINEIQQ